MILCYTQEEKQIIERNGLYVIEYKRMCYKAIKQREAVKTIMQSLADTVKAACKTLEGLVAEVTKALEDISFAIKQHAQNQYRAHTVRAILKYNKCNKPYHGKRRIDIRCRSRC